MSGSERLAEKYVVAVIFVLALFMDLLDTTIVNVALPTLGRQFHAANGTIEWVVLGYLLSLAVWIPASGWIGDRFGTKRTFLSALTIFLLGSALCATATSLDSLVLFRIIQGIGGGMLTPVGTAMLFRAFPPSERARASTVLIIPTVLAPAVGPVVGGYLVDQLSWRWIFIINLPVGLVTLVFGARLLREHLEPSSGLFDVPGFLLSAAGLATLLFALSSGPSAGWTSARVLAMGTAGALAIVALIVVETRRRDPILALRLFADRLFRVANVTSVMATASFLGLVFLMPLFLQQLRGLSALHSGLTTFPQALGVIAAAQFAGRLYARVGARRLLVGGLLTASFAAGLLVTVDLDTHLWVISAILFLRGAGMGFVFVPLQAATFATISSQDTGRASALFSTQRQVAAAIGVAALSTILATRTTQRTVDRIAAARLDAQVGAYHDTFLAVALIALAGAFTALALPNRAPERSNPNHLVTETPEGDHRHVITHH